MEIWRQAVIPDIKNNEGEKDTLKKISRVSFLLKGNDVLKIIGRLQSEVPV